MAAALAADQRSLQPVLDSNPGAAENRGRSQKEITILKTPQTDNLARGNHVVPTEWAEQLERERDEARERIERQKLEINRLNGATNHAGGTPLKTALRERDAARELVKYYQEYSKLLIGEINDTASLAYVCGWRSNYYQKGEVLREKIKQMEETK